MPVYAFRGRHLRTNENVIGERFSANPQALAAVLRREQVAPISIHEKKARKPVFSLRKAVPKSEVALFTRQFSVMLDAGLPLVQCLETMATQNTNAAFRSVLDQIRGDVEAGSTLADAMARHPKVFDSLYTNMIAAGEAGGILDTILQRLAQFIEKIVKLKRALRSALIYPIAVLSIAVVVVGIILWKVVPVFKTLFEGFDLQLPLATRFVLALSNFLESYIFFMAAGAILAAFGLRSYYQTDKGRHMIDRSLLRVPVLGEVFRKIGVARFTRTLATLLSSGVSILEGLEITARTAGNAILEDTVRQIRSNIEEGKNMTDPMRESKFFPAMVTQMVAVGESTGELDGMLVRVADFYEEEVDTTMANLMTLLEPLLMVFLGVIVGGIVIAMYMPLFKLIETLSGG